MPKIHLKTATFFKYLGKHLELEELENICFDFGIEVEKDNEDPDKIVFEIPANRYDLLCVEGLTDALGVFLGLRKAPVFHLKKGTEKIIVKKSTKQIRPFVVSAILRNVTLDQDRYESFIDLQDKLHQNICRRRTLVAIGTHDYDTIQGPFVYDALPPKEISFIPLNQTEKMDGERLMEFYSSDMKLKQFLPIIRDSPVYPVIYDANKTVMSLPPIINGDHSKIKLTTKNIYIESTATDYTKALIVLNTVVAMFSRYCGEEFTTEYCENVYEDGEETRVTPQFNINEFQADIDYLSKLTGITDLKADQTVELLGKMALDAAKIDDKKVSVKVPITRSDVLHACDIAEDVAIAYGYNNIENALPTCITVGSQLTVNKLSDLVRQEVAQCGYKECLNFVLCSLEEISSFLKRDDEVNNAVHIANPKTLEFQCARTTLIPGVLKTLTSNKAQKLPIKLFEVGDVVIRADNEVGAKNQRRLCAAYTDQDSSGLEFIHGLLDYLMLKLNIPHDEKNGYSIKESENPTFFPQRQAEVFLHGESVGFFGIVHPEISAKNLEKIEKLKDKPFELATPVSLIELNLEALILKGFFREK